MRISKSDISLELECWVDNLSDAQIAAIDKIANEHNAIKSALKSALSTNDGKELFNGQVFQAYSFKGKVLQELKEATLPKKKPPPANESSSRSNRKRNSNYVYLKSSDDDDDDEEDDNIPLAKRLAIPSTGKKSATTVPSTRKILPSLRQKSGSGKNSPQLNKSTNNKNINTTTGTIAKSESAEVASSSTNCRPSEISAVGGLLLTNEKDNSKDNGKDNKDSKLQGKTFPSLVVIAKPFLKVKDMSTTRSKLDSKVKLVLMLTPNKFTEFLLQEGLLKAEQKCANHRTNELKLGVYSDATKFPYTGGYVWISECCPTRFVSVFHGSIFEAAPHPPSCILKLIYHWSCQTNIQNVVQWVKVDNVYIKGVYTWLRAICTLAVHQKLKKIGGPDKYIEVGVISLGTTTQDGLKRQVKVEVLGIFDHSEKIIRLRAVEPISDADRNYKRRFQTILEPLQRWVHKESIIAIDLTVDKSTLHQMGFKHVIQANANDTKAVHTNSAVMDYLRRVVPRMFQNTLSLLSRQMIQQFLDELVWREQYGTYALQAFNNITSHIAEQTRLNTTETLTQRLYQVATNPFKDWSILPANCKETPASVTPKRLKNPINEADYINLNTTTTTPTNTKSTKKEKEKEKEKERKKETKKEVHHPPPKRAVTITTPLSKKRNSVKPTPPPPPTPTHNKKKVTVNETKVAPKKAEDELKGLEEMYYGIIDGVEQFYEKLPNHKNEKLCLNCTICTDTFTTNATLQKHILMHINLTNDDDDIKNTEQCIFCLKKFENETDLNLHKTCVHPYETRCETTSSYICLICQKSFNSLQNLSVHLQKLHSMLELPYYCQACAYRTSSHNDIIQHFYNEHKQQNFLQCPFCLDIYQFAFKGVPSMKFIEIYYAHLSKHLNNLNDSDLHCNKCCLKFNDKGTLKQHTVHYHVSMLKNANNIRAMITNTLLIPSPKIRTHHREALHFTVHDKKDMECFVFMDGYICAECNAQVINEQHYSSLMKCNKCSYKTHCERGMYMHTINCIGDEGLRNMIELTLAHEIHCICGFSTAIGNKMAHHLTTCGQKTAYSSVHGALENTVKRSMLDMLGLMRRDGETTTTTTSSTITTTTEENTNNDSTVITTDTENLKSLQDDNVLEAMDTDTDTVEQYATTLDNQLPMLVDQNCEDFVPPEEQQPLLTNADDIHMPFLDDLADTNPCVSTSSYLNDVDDVQSNFDAIRDAD